MENQVDTLFNLCAVVGTAVQTNPVLQVISVVLTAMSVGLSIAYRLWRWYKDAKKDGVITPEEVLELKNTIDEANKEIMENKEIK